MAKWLLSFTKLSMQISSHFNMTFKLNALLCEKTVGQKRVALCTSAIERRNTFIFRNRFSFFCDTITVDVQNPNVQISALFYLVWLPNNLVFEWRLKSEQFGSDFGRSVEIFRAKLDHHIYKFLYIKWSSLALKISNRTFSLDQSPECPKSKPFKIRTQIHSVCQTERSVFGRWLYM